MQKLFRTARLLQDVLHPPAEVFSKLSGAIFKKKGSVFQTAIIAGIMAAKNGRPYSLVVIRLGWSIVMCIYQ